MVIAGSPVLRRLAVLNVCKGPGRKIPLRVPGLAQWGRREVVLGGHGSFFWGELLPVRSTFSDSVILNFER
jgi:hypothetical protein